jgi:hypothetical protein
MAPACETGGLGLLKLVWNRGLGVRGFGDRLGSGLE